MTSTPTPAIPTVSSPTLPGSTAAVRGTITLKLDEVLASVGFMPAALIGALAERQFQLVDHHRRKVIKGYKGPGGTRAKRFIASRLYRYGSKKNPNKIDDVQGESFAASGEAGGPYEKRNLQRIETGGSYTTKEPMALPVGGGARLIGGGIIPTKQFVDAVKGKKFIIINTAKSKGLLVVRYDKRGKVGERTAILGKLIMKRTQRPLLGFMRSFDDIEGKHTAAMEKDVELAMNEAGRMRLSRRLDDRKAERAAYQAAMKEALKLNPGEYGPAKKAARAAALAVRGANKVGGGVGGGGA